MTGKLRELGWRELPRSSQLAAALYPDKAPPSVQKGMLDRAMEDGRPENTQRLWERMGRDTKPVASSNYDRVPGLRRVEPKTTGPKSWWQK
jgi:hypothetical protein